MGGGGKNEGTCALFKILSETYMKDLRILHCHYHCCCCEVDLVAVQVILVVGDRSQQPGNATIFCSRCAIQSLGWG